MTKKGLAMKLLLFMIAGFLSSNLLADPPPNNEIMDQLATITNDRNADVSTLSISVENSGHVNGLNFSTHHADGKLTHVTFTPAQIAAPEGVVLDGDATHKVFLLQGTIDDQKGSGHFKVQYLANGLLGTYKSCGGITLRRGPDQKWELLNYQNRPLTEIKVISWTLGISTVENVCPSSAPTLTVSGKSTIPAR